MSLHRVGKVADLFRRRADNGGIMAQRQEDFRLSLSSTKIFLSLRHKTAVVGATTKQIRYYGAKTGRFSIEPELDFGQFWHCGRAHFASAARHGAEFLYGPGRNRDRQEIRRPLFFGTFRAGATPKLAKVELRFLIFATASAQDGRTPHE